MINFIHTVFQIKCKSNKRKKNQHNFPEIWNSKEKHKTKTDKKILKMILIYGIFFGLLNLISDLFAGYSTSIFLRPQTLRYLKSTISTIIVFILFFALKRNIVTWHKDNLRTLYTEWEGLKKDRDNLVVSQQKYRLIVEGANDGIWDWDIEKEQYFFSLKWKTSFGYSKDDLNNNFETWKSLLHPDDVHPAVERLETYIESKEGIYTSTYRLRTKNGGYRWVLSRGKGIWDGEGKIIRFAGSHTDITEQLDLQENARREKEFSESIFNNANIIGLVWQKDGTIVRINPYACDVLGYKHKEMIGSNWLDVLGIEKKQEYIKVLLCNMKQGKTKLNYELRVKCKDGTIIDTIWSNSFIYGWDGNIQGIVSIGTDITDRKLMEKQLYNLAYYDHLTGLPNRMLLEVEVKRIIERVRHTNGKFALLYLDVDNFKYINDMFGHIPGDMLMKHIAQILKNQICPKDIIARAAGDAFIIILTDITGIDDVRVSVEYLLSHSKHPWTIKDQEFFISVNIGITLYPEHGKNLNTLLKNADTAMRAAKEKGKDTYSFYNEYMQAKTLRYINMDKWLRYAIKRNEFKLHYQPQIDLRTKEIYGLEALIRWQHPGEGFIPPSNFIPAAEKMGHILGIEKWVYESVFKQKKKWEEMGLKSVKVSINLSRKGLLSSNLVQDLKTLSRLYSVDCNDIGIEITETDIITNLNTCIAVLKRIKGLGIGIALDDFGTGYSSLNYLEELPIDTLKIDKALVGKIRDGIRDEIIIKTIIQLAHELNLKVVAEGIENDEQLFLLEKYGCDIGQGYMFYRALSPGKIEKILT